MQMACWTGTPSHRMEVTFTNKGNTLTISVPVSSAASVKGKTVTGISAMKDMSTSDPTIWENSSYQTVLTAGGAEFATAYENIEIPVLLGYNIAVVVSAMCSLKSTYQQHRSPPSSGAQ